MTPAHEQLLTEMDQFIELLGGSHYSAAYADVASVEKRKSLARINTIPATYIRTRSDRVCFFQDTRTVLEYDAKTNEKGSDFFVECLPVWHHLIAYRHFGIKTVYGFRWPNRSEFSDIGIVLDNDFRNLVDGVFVYNRQDLADVTDFVITNQPLWFPKAEIIHVDNRRGSGDPSIRVRRQTIANYPHWMEVIKELR
jgi:hypothetical protein